MSLTAAAAPATPSIFAPVSTPASPPPPHNFETVPVAASRRPLWDLKHPDDPDGPHA